MALKSTHGLQHNLYTTVTLIFTMVMSLVVWADVPPPPVNQLLGTRDTEFPNLVESDCRFCHEHPEAFPVEDATLPNRHHLLYGQAIPAGTEVPNPDANGDGIPDTEYDCLTCHSLMQDGNGDSVFSDFRDCMTSGCHFRPAGQPSPHHGTQAARDSNCDFCHGSVIDNPADGHYIPSGDLPPDLPSIGCKLWEGEPFASRCLAGGCFACHLEDLSADPPIASTGDVHHYQNFNCSYCHQVHFGQGFRDCEVCHGIDSLHNIQADSNGDGIVTPGAEDPYWGHIGNDIDCEGCHYVPAAEAGALAIQSLEATSTPAPLSGPTIPYITSLSANYLISGESAELTISGASFLNTSTDTSGNATTLISDVMLDSATVNLVLTPNSVTENQLLVTIPADLATGNYDLTLVKDTKQSNKRNLSIIPAAVINDLRLKRETLTITGSGFGKILLDVAAETGVYILDQQAAIKCKADLISWTDSEIVAQPPCAGKSDTVRVTTLYTSLEAPLGDTKGGGKGGGRK